MNKLSKIALVSSLSILGGKIAFGGVVLAQEPSSTPVENPNPETKEAPQTNTTKPNPRLKNRDSERKSAPTENKEITSQASEKRTQNMEQRELNVAERTANREQRIKDRCEAVGMRIVNHQKMFTSKSQARLTKYNQITTRLEAISTKLTEKGIDITNYNSYITELKAKTTALNVLNQDYIQLFGSKANTGEFCNNKEQLVTEIEARKAKLQLVITKDKEIRMYIKNTILPYLKGIKTESASTITSTTPSNTQVQPQ